MHDYKKTKYTNRKGKIIPAGGQLNKYLFGGDIPRRENYGLMNDGNIVYADSPNLSLPKPPVFDPNAGRKEAYNTQWEAYRKKLAQEVMNGSARKINMRKEERRFQRNFDQTWNDQELSRKASFDIANGPGGLLKPTPVETPQTTSTYFDDNLIKKYPNDPTNKEYISTGSVKLSNEARGQKNINQINHKVDSRIAAQNAKFEQERQARKDDYWLKQALQYGDFKTLQDVKNWLAKYGLNPDGKFGSKSKEMFNKIEEAKRIRKELSKTNKSLLYELVDFPQKEIAWIKQKNKLDRLNPYNGKIESLISSNMPSHILPPRPRYEEIPHNIQVPEEEFITDNIVRPEYRESILKLLNDTEGDLNLDKVNRILSFPVKFKKTGGTMNKYQQGGVVPQQDIQQQVKQLVQAAIVQKNLEAVKQIKQIIEAAQQGDEQAIQIAQFIQQEIEAIQKAKLGAKLNYIKALKGGCAEDEELVYFLKGGKVCSKCEKKHKEAEKINKPSNNAVEEFKKGRRMKKCQEGGNIQQPVKKQIGANRIFIDGSGKEQRYWTDGTVSEKYPIDNGKKTVVIGRDPRTIGILHGNKKQHEIADSIIKTDFTQKFRVPELNAK